MKHINEETHRILKLLFLILKPASILDKAKEREVSDFNATYPTPFSLILNESSSANRI